MDIDGKEYKRYLQTLSQLPKPLLITYFIKKNGHLQIQKLVSKYPHFIQQYVLGFFETVKDEIFDSQACLDPSFRENPSLFERKKYSDKILDGLRKILSKKNSIILNDYLKLRKLKLVKEMNLLKHFQYLFVLVVRFPLW